MGLLELILGRKKNISKQEVMVKAKEELGIHPDIQNLLWIADGPRKNYISNNHENVFYVQGQRFILPSLQQEEPSLIYTNLPISNNIEDNVVERPSYYPTYSELTAEQRGIYWQLLANPYDERIDIGYVFILYYGLERHLLMGNYERAFEVILKLRDVHTNKSFQCYSARALILMCICKQRGDLAMQFMHSLDKEYESQFDDIILLLCKCSLNLPLSAKEIMKLSKGSGFSNQRYIKDYPDIFEQYLTKNIEDRYSTDMLFITSLISFKLDFELPKRTMTIFANMSIIGESVEIPDFTQVPVIQGEIYKLLHETHEQVKCHLKELRKSGAVIEKNKVTKKVEEIKLFDEIQELELLQTLEDKNATLLDKHFCLIKLQDFYYKYRAVDDTSIQKCIMYCIQDIELLEDMQKEYYQLEVMKMKQFERLYSKEEFAKRLQGIGAFAGNIPAFKRLAIIYEKEKAYVKAASICDQAIEYYLHINMVAAAEEFQKRKDKYFKDNI